MSVPNEPTQTLTKAREPDATVQTNIEFEVQAESLLDEAREADAGQSSLIDSAPVESQYTAASIDARYVVGRIMPENYPSRHPLGRRR